MSVTIARTTGAQLRSDASVTGNSTGLRSVAVMKAHHGTVTQRRSLDHRPVDQTAREMSVLLIMRSRAMRPSGGVSGAAERRRTGGDRRHGAARDEAVEGRHVGEHDAEQDEGDAADERRRVARHAVRADLADPRRAGQDAVARDGEHEATGRDDADDHVLGGQRSEDGLRRTTKRPAMQTIVMKT